LEVACDESGYEGEKLIGTTTDVFAHASVRLDPAAAARCVRELRERIRSPAEEYKANHLLREKHRPALEWLLRALPGEAHVYLMDKVFFVVATVIGLLVTDHADAIARIVYRDGPRVFGRRPWEEFLVSANNLMRTRDVAAESVDAFDRVVGALRVDRTDGILERLAQVGPDPLIPAIARAVAHWGAGGQPIVIVHDRQTTLSKARIARLVDSSHGGLAELRLVDSRVDPRVQVADIVAGVARKIASDELNDRGDTVLTRLLRPYVDPSSIWGDDDSWYRLTGLRPDPTAPRTPG
jgi:hypothetical protein